jgi:hypothetical protein
MTPGGGEPSHRRLAPPLPATARAISTPARAQPYGRCTKGWGTLLETLPFCSTRFFSLVLHIVVLPHAGKHHCWRRSKDAFGAAAETVPTVVVLVERILL